MRKTAKKIKRLPVNKMKKKLDAVFSQFIRQRDKGICFTCRVIKPWKEQQAGHYWSRSFNSIRFDERNVHCQCVSCNIFKYGNKEVYSLRMIEKYGVQILDELNRKRRLEKRFSTKELEDMIQQYRLKLTPL